MLGIEIKTKVKTGFESSNGVILYEQAKAVTLIRSESDMEEQEIKINLEVFIENPRYKNIYVFICLIVLVIVFCFIL